MSTRHIGNCQICERDQKLHGKMLVHHGYRRPGHGFIEGDCPGVGELPYELSCEAIKAYVLRVGEHLAGLRARLALLGSREVVEITEVRLGSAWGAPKIVTFRLGITEPQLWERAYERESSRVRTAIRGSEAEIERCGRRVAAWKPAPVRSVEEEAAKARAGRQERERAATEKRDARRAEEERKRQKRAALEAKRQAVKDGFVARLAALTAPGVGVDVEVEKRKILSDLRLKKHSFIWGLQDLRCEEICIKLGLARREDGGWVRYAD